MHDTDITIPILTGSLTVSDGLFVSDDCKLLVNENTSPGYCLTSDCSIFTGQLSMKTPGHQVIQFIQYHKQALVLQMKTALCIFSTAIFNMKNREVELWRI